MQTKIYRPDVAIIVLTRNAGALWSRWIKGVQQQTILAGRYLVVDSESIDQTVSLSVQAGFEVYTVRQQDFNHGGTRQWAAEQCPEMSFVVYLTQDAILTEPDAVERLLAHFTDNAELALAYGRHVVRADAGLLEQHARQYNYPEQVCLRDRQSFMSLGYRAAFASDVYAAYRVAALRSIGGFPRQIIVSEDSYVCARLLLAGWKTVYAADSRVEHSHRLSLLKIFRRYFDIGVFHANEQALMQAVGLPDQESGAYVRSLIRFLWQQQAWLLPLAGLQTLLKLAGFRLGQNYWLLPMALRLRLSLQKAYWLQLRNRESTQPPRAIWQTWVLAKQQ